MCISAQTGPNWTVLRSRLQMLNHASQCAFSQFCICICKPQAQLEEESLFFLFVLFLKVVSFSSGWHHRVQLFFFLPPSPFLPLFEFQRLSATQMFLSHLITGSLQPSRPPTASGLSLGPPVGLWCCCSVEVEWVGRYEVECCGVAALGWAPLRPHCLCWMRMGVEVGVAWVGVLMKVVFLLWLILYCCLISGSGSSGTPGRSSHGCSCGQAASQE